MRDCIGSCIGRALDEICDDHLPLLHADCRAKLAEAQETNRKLHRRAQAAEGALSDLDWALDYYKLRPRNTQWQGYGEIDVARRIRDAESKLAEANALSDMCEALDQLQKEDLYKEEDRK